MKGDVRMDILMIAVLLGGFALIVLLTKWCQKQIDAQE